jgi:hypothetical protein
MPHKDPEKRRAAVRAAHAKAKAADPEAAREYERYRKAERRQGYREQLLTAKKAAVDAGQWSPKAEKLLKEIEAAFERLPDEGKLAAYNERTDLDEKTGALWNLIGLKSADVSEAVVGPIATEAGHGSDYGGLATIIPINPEKITREILLAQRAGFAQDDDLADGTAGKRTVLSAQVREERRIQPGASLKAVGRPVLQARRHRGRSKRVMHIEHQYGPKPTDFRGHFPLSLPSRVAALVSTGFPAYRRLLALAPTAQAVAVELADHLMADHELHLALPWLCPWKGFRDSPPNSAGPPSHDCDIQRAVETLKYEGLVTCLIDLRARFPGFVEAPIKGKAASSPKVYQLLSPALPEKIKEAERVEAHIA